MEYHLSASGVRITPRGRHPMLSEPRVTVKIPRPLYRKIQHVIEGSGFSSPTDFIVFVMRDLVGEADAKVEARPKNEVSSDDLEAIKRKLKNLGYL